MSQPVSPEVVAVLTAQGIHLQQAAAPQPPGPAPRSLRKLLRAEVDVIGAVQILGGVMTLALGVILASAPVSPHLTRAFSALLTSGYPFVGALCFIVSGSLSIAAGKKSTKLLVRSSLAASLLSALLALLGLLVLFLMLAALSQALEQCDLSKADQPTSSYPFYYYDSNSDCSAVKASLVGAGSVMLVCAGLELCLAVLMTVLWWRQARSDFAGSVLFQPRNDPSLSRKACGKLVYEELLES